MADFIFNYEYVQLDLILGNMPDGEEERVTLCVTHMDNISVLEYMSVIIEEVADRYKNDMDANENLDVTASMVETVEHQYIKNALDENGEIAKNLELLGIVEMEEDGNVTYNYVTAETVKNSLDDECIPNINAEIRPLECATVMLKVK